MRASDKVVIQTDKAPKAIGPYSQAIKYGNFMFLAGQIALDPATGKIVGATVVEQTERVLKNIEEIIHFAGLTMGHIIRCVVYVTDLREMAAINQVYAKHFVYEPPVRTTVQVAALPGGALIEIEATAMLSTRIGDTEQRGPRIS